MEAIAYVRVSSKEQEREGFSIPAQKKLLSEYAFKNNLSVRKVFEESETAKVKGRKQFSKMVDFLRDNPEIKILLVEKTDRLYRNFHDYVELDFESLGVTIHLVKENEVLSKDSKSHEKFIHGIKMLMAKNYIDSLSEEVKKGMNEKACQGLWPSCAPTGYMNKLDDKTIIPHPDESLMIRKLFKWASTGQYSLQKLSKKVYFSGMRGRRGGKIAKSTIAKILSNPLYYGDFVWKKVKYKGKHEPIISKQLFDKVQIVLEKTQKPKVTKHNFTFGGILKCGHCGCSITAEKKTKKSGKTYTYYHCTNGKGICENVKYLSETKVEKALSEAFRAIQVPSEIVEWTREALLESSKEEREYREAEVKRLNARYVKLESFISKSYDHMLEGRIKTEMWESRTAEWKSEQEEITTRLNAINHTNTDYLLEGIRLMELASKAADLFEQMTIEEKREILSLVLSNPVIKNGSIEYHYKKPFAMFANVTDLNKWRAMRDSNPRPLVSKTSALSS